MKEFTEIESFRHIVASVRRYCTEKSKPLPVIAYQGTVKLHGTNAGVRVTADKVQPQKRTGIVDIGADNAGFAAFCHGKNELFQQIAHSCTFFRDEIDITLFGEWCGGNIQKNVAVTQLDKHFVIFAAYNARDDRYLSVDEIAVIPKAIPELNANNIYFINQIPRFTITIDFSKPEDSLDKLNELTIAVEEECPWGKFRGVSGVGEGIVWTPVKEDLSSVTGLWFKTKGMKHAAKDGSKKTNVQASPEKLESIRQVVEAVLPVWRLEQGITKLKEDNLEITPQNTGNYLKWICQDILKEETDVIVANGLDWKALNPFITREARQWYLMKVNDIAN